MNPVSADPRVRDTAPPEARDAAAPDAAPRRNRVRFVPLALILLFLSFTLLPRVHDHPGVLWAFVATAAVLLAWSSILLVLAAKRGWHLGIERVPVVKSHYVQACVHTSIYAYWGWYWRPVYSEAPLILAQVVFLYVLDALLCWSRGRAWRPGFGPLPIIFSTNLFIWFKDDWFALQFLMVATGALGKEFVRWRRGDRLVHIFNPSAVGLALVSVVLIAIRKTDITWGVEIASTLALPPHIYLEIFLLGLVVQYFFAVTLMTLSATAVLVLMNWVYFRVTGTYQFIDTNIPIAVFLGLHLLVTDPATSPRSSLGRVIFGGLYGVGNFVLYTVFFHMNAPEFYDKLLPVPLLNLSVRVIDRWTGRGVPGAISRWEARFPPRRTNLAYMGCWAVLFLAMLGTGYVDAPHPGATFEFWKKAYAEGRPNAGAKLLRITQSQAAQGIPAACNQLGLLYMNGEVIGKDRAAAGHYFATACQAGDLDGCANLSTQFLFLREARSEKDVARGLERLERECGQGRDAGSCFLIGFAYETGRGRPADPVRARQLYREGARRGSADACKALLRIAAAGGGSTDLEDCARVLEVACERGDAESCLLLATMLHAGAGTPHDDEKAREFLRRACTLGSDAACQAIEAAALPTFSVPRAAQAPRWRESTLPAGG